MESAPGIEPAGGPSTHARQRIRAALVSLVAGTIILGAKLVGWWVTGSTAVLSDALEAIVNVVAASFALYAVTLAARPADHGHPYGHGKIEFLAAAFEGGLVSLAAVLIVFEAVSALVRGPELRSLDVALAITGATALGNLALGSWVLAQGRRLGSATLVADGQHVLSDVWTTAGVLVGLALVRLTGLTLFDPLAAIGVGLLLARTGVKLVREAAGPLMDAGDPATLERVVRAFNDASVPGLTSLHRLRVQRFGRDLRVDAHIVMPRHFTVDVAHAAAADLGDRLARTAGLEVDVALHFDPCAPEGCASCDLEPCPQRAAPLVSRPALTLERALRDRP